MVLSSLVTGASIRERILKGRRHRYRNQSREVVTGASIRERILKVLLLCGFFVLI